MVKHIRELLKSFVEQLDRAVSKDVIDPMEIAAIEHQINWCVSELTGKEA